MDLNTISSTNSDISDEYCIFYNTEETRSNLLLININKVFSLIFQIFGFAMFLIVSLLNTLYSTING